MISNQNVQTQLQDAIRSRYPELLLQPQDVEIGEPMCSGNDGSVVHRGKVKGKIQCSIKPVPLTLSSHEQLERLETALTKISSSSAFVNLYGFCFGESGDCKVISDWMKYNLSDIIYGKELRLLTLLKRRTLGLDIVRMIKALHQQGIVHGSLKPQNILINEDITEVKVCAFDIFRLDGPARPSHEKADVFYASPEQILGELPSVEGDIYSLGLILLEIETHQQVWIELNDDTWRLSEMVISDKRPDQLKQLRGETRDVIDRCLSRDVQRRPSVEILESLLTRLVEQAESVPEPPVLTIPIPYRPRTNSLPYPGTPAECGPILHAALDEAIAKATPPPVCSPRISTSHLIPIAAPSQSDYLRVEFSSSLSISPPTVPEPTDPIQIPPLRLTPAYVGVSDADKPSWKDVYILSQEDKKKLVNPVVHWIASPSHPVFVHSLSKWGTVAGREWGPNGYNKWTGKIGVIVDEQMHLCDPTDLTPSADPFNAPWFRSTVNVCHVPFTTQAMRQVLAKPVPGLGGLLTFMDVLREIWSRGICILVVGGAVRDTVMGKTMIKDIDVTFDCSAEELVQIAKEMNWPVTTLTPKGLVQLGDTSSPLFFEGRILGGWNSDIHPVDNSPRISCCDLAMDVISRDYCCNVLYYDPINETVIDPTGLGISDARRKLLRPTVSEPHWDEWFEGNPFKSARFWKMRARGFTPADERFREWFIAKARANYGTHKFLRQGWCLKYLVRAIGRSEWAQIRQAVTEDMGEQFCNDFWAPL